MKSTFLFLLSLRIFIFILTWLKEKAFKKIKSLLQTFYRVSQKWLWSYDLWLLWVMSRVYTVLYMDVSQKTIGKDRTEKGASLYWSSWWRNGGQEKVDPYLKLLASGEEREAKKKWINIYFDGRGKQNFFNILSIRYNPNIFYFLKGKLLGKNKSFIILLSKPEAADHCHLLLSFEI